MPSSQTLWPATLWAPLRTASSSPVSRASVTTLGDLAGVLGPHDHRRAPVEAAVEDGAGLVVPGVVGREHAAVEGVAKARDRKNVGA